MQSRLKYIMASPAAYKAMMGLEEFVLTSGLELSLIELVKLRASQINGCAFCVDMHWKDARNEGETEERLYMLSAWHEAGVYTERERAALALTEAVTLVSETHVPDAVYDEAKQHFTDAELVNLTTAIATINAWNRLAITFRAEPGRYKPKKIEVKHQSPVA